MRVPPLVHDLSSARAEERSRCRGLLVTGTGLVLGGLLSVLLVAGPASAHASLVGSNPQAGATLTAAPTRVVVTFDENVRTPSAIVVTGPGGRVSHGAVQVVDNTVSIAVTVRAAPAYVGSYDLAYRVVSADGHPVTGEIPFRYQPPGVRASTSSTAARPATKATDQGSAAPFWVVGGVAVVGVAALLLGGRRLRRGGSR